MDRNPGEFEELCVFYRDHHPDQKEDWRFGMLASVVANAHSAKPEFQPQDFMPALTVGPKKTPDELERDLKLYVISVGGRINK
jgi:hypothetical protein